MADLLISNIDWDILNVYINKNLIIANKHPEYDLWLLNYSPKVSFGRCWDLFSLSSRGMVIDANGNIIARCLKKFFNYNEPNPYDIDLNQSYKIFDKIDGSTMHLFWYDHINQWIIASRDSFISEQVIEAQKILKLKSYDILDKKFTYIFEIIYPQNKIVVDYGNTRDLILLTRIETKTGIETNYNDLIKLYSKVFTLVERLNLKIKNINELKKFEEDNKEGFVIKYADGNRLKFKFDSYVKLRGIMTNVSNITVWEYLMNNYNFDNLLKKIPDEFLTWIKNTAKLLQDQFNEIERLVLKEFFRIYYVNKITNRKEFAAQAIKTNYQQILFKLYERKPYNELIWNLIKPTISKSFYDKYEAIE